MKRILLFTALIAALAGCTESAEVEGLLTASPLRIDSPASGEQKTIAIQSKCDWTAECDADWITLNSTRGDAGKSELKITVLTNTSTEKRTAGIRIGNSEYDIAQNITVTQKAFEPNLSPSQSTLRCGTEGDTFEITVQANIGWSATCDAPWITFSPQSSSSDNTVMNVTVASNSSTTQRDGEIILTNEQYGIRESIKVVQSDFKPEIKPSQTDAGFASRKDSVKVEIAANIPWQASCEAEWVTLETSENSLWIKVAASFSTENRETQVVLQNEQYGIKCEIKVVQNAESPFLEIDKTRMELFPDFSLETGAQRADNSLVRISGNVPWTAASSEAWVRPALTENESGEKRIRILAENNYSDSPRTAEITFKNERYGISRTLTVVQQAPLLRFITDNHDLILGAEEQTVTARIEYNINYIFTLDLWPGWQITANETSDFICTKTISIPRNTDDAERYGKIYVKNAKGFDYPTSDTVFITQRAR